MPKRVQGQDNSPYEDLVRRYRSGKIILSPKQKIIFKAILRGREERTLTHKLELGEALFCTLVVADPNLDRELEWWKPS